jgi:hypothetical protein
VLSETYGSLNEWPRLSLWQAAKHRRRTSTHGRSANPGAETLPVTFDLAPWEPQKRWGPSPTLAASPHKSRLKTEAPGPRGLLYP